MTWYYRNGNKFEGENVKIINKNTAETSELKICDRCGGNGGSEA